ncbi:hypothetical protein [Streptomyces sp. NPDC090798]|uniref:hypothetical protein n=1 Tax=Streptomyces sp. NPDC090798 TaxID=3365968 RepID=UPI003823B33D
MSAPLVVNTVDGTVWLRRAATRGGLALYAPQDVCRCPEFVMATEAELAEHGIAGSADVLPMPVGTGPSERESLRAAFVAALSTAHKTQPCSCGSEIWSSCYHPDRPGRTHSERRADAVLAVRDAEVERLQARIAELEAERHTTNEALDDAVQALRGDRPEPAKGPSAAESADRLTAFFAPVASLREEPVAEAATPRMQAMRALLDGQRAAVEDPHDGPLAHQYRVGRDLPEIGGAR